MTRFIKGEKVLTCFAAMESSDPLHLGVAEIMREAAKKKKVLTITSIVVDKLENSRERVRYYLNNYCVYSENWLIKLKPEATYHKDPKINAVILKMKSLDKKFNERNTNHDTIFGF